MSNIDEFKNNKKPPVRISLVIAFTCFIGILYVFLLLFMLDLFQIESFIVFMSVSLGVFTSMVAYIFHARERINNFLRPIPDNIAKTEVKIAWFFVALIFVTLVFFFCVGLLWFYRDYRVSLIAWTGLEDLKWNRDYATSICVGAFAFWGFVVVVWRGLLHHEQVTNQIKQLDLGNKQQRETENNNLAKLMISGAEKLSPDMPEEQQVTGMACLSYIVKNNGSFTREAVGIIKALVERTGKQNPKGVYIETNQLFFDALNILDQYAECKNEFMIINNVKVAQYQWDRYDRWKWLHSLCYVDFYFKDIYFDDTVVFFYNARSDFRNCRIESTFRMRSIPERINKLYYDSDTDQIRDSGRLEYNTPSVFKDCIFENGTKSDDSFRDIYNIKIENHVFDNCYYDDALITNGGIRAVFKDLKIRPISKLTAEERSKIGPQTT